MLTAWVNWNSFMSLLLGALAWRVIPRVSVQRRLAAALCVSHKSNEKRAIVVNQATFTPTRLAVYLSNRRVIPSPHCLPRRATRSETSAEGCELVRRAGRAQSHAARCWWFSGDNGRKSDNNCCSSLLLDRPPCRNCISPTH